MTIWMDIEDIMLNEIARQKTTDAIAFQLYVKYRNKN